MNTHMGKRLSHSKVEEMNTRKGKREHSKVLEIGDVIKQEITVS